MGVARSKVLDCGAVPSHVLYRYGAVGCGFKVVCLGYKSVKETSICNLDMTDLSQHSSFN